MGPLGPEARDRTKENPVQMARAAGPGHLDPVFGPFILGLGPKSDQKLIPDPDRWWGGLLSEVWVS